MLSYFVEKKIFLFKDHIFLESKSSFCPLEWRSSEGLSVLDRSQTDTCYTCNLEMKGFTVQTELILFGFFSLYLRLKFDELHLSIQAVNWDLIQITQ